MPRTTAEDMLRAIQTWLRGKISLTSISRRISSIWKERGSKISIVFDIVNVGNLLNKKWGKVYSSSYAENILNVTSVSYDRNTKIATPSYRFLGYKPEVSDIYSRWHMQLGLRATF